MFGGYAVGMTNLPAQFSISPAASPRSGRFISLRFGHFIIVDTLPGSYYVSRLCSTPSLILLFLPFASPVPESVLKGKKTLAQRTEARKAKLVDLKKVRMSTSTHPFRSRLRPSIAEAQGHAQGYLQAC